MDGPEVLVPLGFFAMIAAIFIVPNWLKGRERQELQALLRSAIDKGQPLPPEAIEALTKNVKAPSTSFGDLRTGIIWLAIGLGIALLGFIMGYVHADAFHPILAAGSIPTVIGLAYILLSFINPNKAKA